MTNEEELRIATKVIKLTKQILSLEVDGYEDLKLPDMIKKKIFWLMRSLGIEYLTYEFDIQADEDIEASVDWSFQGAKFKQENNGDEDKVEDNTIRTKAVYEKLIPRQIVDDLEKLFLAPIELLATTRSVSSTGTIQYEPIDMTINIDENIDEYVTQEFDDTVWTKEDGQIETE